MSVMFTRRILGRCGVRVMSGRGILGPRDSTGHEQDTGQLESDHPDEQPRHDHLPCPAPAEAEAGIAKRESSIGGLTRTVSTVRR